MKLDRNAVAGFAFAVIASIGAFNPAQAAIIGNGNVGISVNGVPQIDLSASPATYTASFLNTFETFGTGAFTNVTNKTGYMNGQLTFSSTRGTTINETLTDFLVFNDGQGGTYNFSVTSALTRNYTDTPGVSTSIGLYLLGTTLDAHLGFDPTPTSLTLTFNSTNGSAYSASATLAVPPATLDTTPVPEPMSMALLGTGLVGLGVVRRFQSSKA